ncbi:RVT_3 domain-containing protein [Cephalotus follicularis]|uniref:RVT_3 domain-containing protein n=1 Tax=Cephalotus follicularis TaxID=3775 RepID=A0A1Q3CLM7_CEPFO|nr:RVT_3 domain-containing protein [Cephalotus follicularis]
MHLYSQHSRILEFDGASKGNPGPAGAGAVLRFKDQSKGMATNNLAEYLSLILGLKYALNIGIKHICIKGDLKLVCMQVQGLWKINQEHLAVLCREARDLKDLFMSFQINHVLRVAVHGNI